MQIKTLLQKVKNGLSYCPKCEVRLKKDDKFCYACGTPVAKVVKEEFSVSADDLIEKVRELLHDGNVTRIVVKDEKGKVLLEIPVTVGIIGVVLAPWLAALGVIAALATNCTVVVERRE
jgi:CBS domain-containing protein